MHPLYMAGIGFIGIVIPVLSPEVSAVLAGRGGMHPVEVGLATSFGQCCMYLVLFLAGGKIVPKLKWLARQVERTRTRFEKHLEKAYLGTAVVAAFIGVPPLAALFVLARSFDVGFVRLVIIAFAFRAMRFGVLAAGGLGLFA